MLGFQLKKFLCVDIRLEYGKSILQCGGLIIIFENTNILRKTKQKDNICCLKYLENGVFDKKLDFWKHSTIVQLEMQ